MSSKGHKLSGILDDIGEAGPVVVSAHGWTSGKESITYTALTDELNKKGISHFRFDFYGHGESPGKIEDMTISEGIDDVMSAIKFVREKGFSPVGLFASSFGGVCASLAAAQSGVKAMALKHPVSEYTESMLDNKGVHVRNDYTKYSAYAVAENITCPVLIVHGDKDDRVPIQQSRKLAELLPQATLEIIPEATHAFTDQETKKAVQMAAEFFAEYLQ